MNFFNLSLRRESISRLMPGSARGIATSGSSRPKEVLENVIDQTLVSL